MSRQFELGVSFFAGVMVGIAGLCLAVLLGS